MPPTVRVFFSPSLLVFKHRALDPAILTTKMECSTQNKGGNVLPNIKRGLQEDAKKKGRGGNGGIDRK